MAEHRTISFSALLAAPLALLVPAVAFADPLPVYGGPAYDAPTQTGYRSPELPVAPGFTAGNGTAVGAASKSTGGIGLGTRAVRWDASGSAATELGHLGTNSGGATQSQAYAVNSAGTAVGFAEKFTGGTYLERRAVRWDAGGSAAMELGNLGTGSPGVSSSTAWAINAAGTAVGAAYKWTNGTLLGNRAVRWDASGTAATELGNLGTSSSGEAFGRAWAVNDAGTAVGSADKYVGGNNVGERAVRWDASGTAATELNSLGTGTSGNTYSEALAVNSAGTAVGYSFKFTGNPFESDVGTRAVRWDASGTAATELGHLGTDGSGSTFAKAWAVNDAGTAIGSAVKYTAGSYLGNQAVRWDAGGTAATELGNLGISNSGFFDTVANALNSSGVAVGIVPKYTDGTFAGNRAVLWNLDAVAIDLNTLIDPDSGWTLLNARGISDTNWVSGIGLFDPDGGGALAPYTRAFLLDVSSVVPEPAAGLMILIGALSLLRRDFRVRFAQ